MKSPIKVLFYEPYPMGLGGNFLTQRLILERLDRRKFHPIIMAPIEGAALERFREMGLECVVMPPSGGLDRYGQAVLREGLSGRFYSAMHLMRYNLQLARFLIREKVNIVYANCVRAQMCVAIAAKLARVLSFLYVKGELANPVIDALSLFSADRISFNYRHNLSPKYPGLFNRLEHRITVVYGGFEAIELNRAYNANKDELERELALDPGILNTCVVGQICPMKGQHVVIKALSELGSSIDKIRVYFVGDSVIEEYRPYMESLKSLVESSGLSETVKFLGWRNDALKIMACMDLLIIPSYAEGFARAALEGMALGLPVIATEVGVLPEAIVDGVNGFLTAPGDHAQLALRWRDLLSSPELRHRMGQEARRTIFAKFLIDDKVAQLCKIWEEMSS